MSSRKKAPIPAFAKVAQVGAVQRAAALDPAPLNAEGLRRPGSADELAAVLGTSAATEKAVPSLKASTQGLAPALLVSGQPRRIDTVQDLATVVEGETVMLNTQLVGDNRDNAREFYRSAEVDATGHSIQRNKQDSAANGWVEGPQVLLRDGGKRLRGSRAFSVTHLLVRIEKPPKDRLDAWQSSRRMNMERSTHTVYDDAFRFKQYLDEHLVNSQAELAGLISEPGEPPRSAGYVSQIVAIAAIPRSIVARLVEIPALCSKNAAFEISRLYTPDGQQRLVDAHPGTLAEDAALILAEQVAEQVISAATANKELTSAEVKKIVERAMGESKRAPRARSTSEPVALSSWNARMTAIPKHKLLRVEFHDIEEDQMDVLREKLKTLFDQGA